METQTEASVPQPQLSPTVRLKNGTTYSRHLVNQVMRLVEKMRDPVQMPNGALLLNDLVMKCRDAEHQYYDGTQWVLSSYGLLDTDGFVLEPMRDIILAALIGQGSDFGFTSPIAD